MVGLLSSNINQTSGTIDSGKLFEDTGDVYTVLMLQYQGHLHGGIYILTIPCGMFVMNYAHMEAVSY